MATTAHGAHDDHAAHEHPIPSGWRRFVYSTNHKDIGTMYLVFAMVAGVIGGFMSVAIRMAIDKTAPTNPPTSAKIKYIVPMSLWLVE